MEVKSRLEARYHNASVLILARSFLFFPARLRSETSVEEAVRVPRMSRGDDYTASATGREIG